jgi:hypothetical protein
MRAKFIKQAPIPKDLRQAIRPPGGVRIQPAGSQNGTPGPSWEPVKQPSIHARRPSLSVLDLD